MKTSIFTFLIALIGVCFNSQAQAKDVNLAEPPFFMMSHYEISEINEIHREKYLAKVVKDIVRLKEAQTRDRIFKEINVQKLSEAAVSEQSWTETITKVYLACQSPKNKPVCKALEDSRIKSFLSKGRATSSESKRN